MAGRAHNPAQSSGAVAMARSYAKKSLNFLLDPDRYFRRQDLTLRHAWWRAMHVWRFREVALRRRLAAKLPQPRVIAPISPAVGASFSTGPAVQALTAEAVQAARDYVDSIDLQRAIAENPGQKSYLIPLAKQRPLPEDSPMYKLALHPELVGTVANYFGYLPLLTYVNVWYSPAWPENEPFVGSQRFHLDNEDMQQAKVFVYLHDVDDDHSPTMYLQKDRSMALCRRHYSDMLKDDIRIDEQLLERESLIHHNGPAGSVVMLDTSGCLHAGGRCRKERRLLVFQYMTPCSHVRNIGKNQSFEFLRDQAKGELDRALLNLS